MAFGAVLVQAGEGQAAGRFHDVCAMRVVTLNAIHSSFDHGMMLRQVEFGMGLQMALEAGGGILARVDDELAAPAAGLGVFAARPMAGFAAGLAAHFGVLDMDAGVRAGSESARDIGMAIKADAIADIGSARYFRRSDDGAGGGRAGKQPQTNCARAGHQSPTRAGAPGHGWTPEWWWWFSGNEWSRARKKAGMGKLRVRGNTSSSVEDST